MSGTQADQSIVNRPELIGGAIFNSGSSHLTGESSDGLIANVWAGVATDGTALICRN